MRAILLCLLAAPTWLTAQQADPRPRLREVRITCADVFDQETADRYLLSRLVNAVHWTTREEVVAREVWLHPGDPVDDELAAEVERNLRGLGLFAEVAARIVPTDTEGVVDLEITTRDRLTLSLSVGASYVGGTASFRSDIGEGNLFGLGDRIGASFSRSSDKEFRGAISYTDLHVLDTWHTASLRLQRTDEGDGFGFAVRRPIKHLADPRGYGGALNYDESEVDYYRDGSSVAQVPDVRSQLSGDFSWAAGPRHRRRTAGLQLVVERHDYEPARGPLAPDIPVPGDTWWVFLGPTAHWQWIHGYREVEGFDTLGYVQDITLGFDVTATIGARWRDEDGAGGDLQPEWSASARWAGEPLTGLFTNLRGAGTLRWDGGEAVGWQAVGSAHVFLAATGRDTLAASVTYDAVDETQDLPVEFLLGEDNGLRGYPSRQFAGTRRLRINLENRFDTGLEVATFRPGMVAFFDAGQTSFDDDFGGLYRAVGFGLRVGSRPLLGSTTLRLDFAHPLDDIGGGKDWQVSFAVGQVFTFGGNGSLLSGR